MNPAETNPNDFINVDDNGTFANYIYCKNFN